MEGYILASGETWLAENRIRKGGNLVHWVLKREKRKETDGKGGGRAF